MGVLARVLIYGDPHLNSKNYGAHRDYAQESLDCYRKITKAVEENGITHLIGLGDFTYGRFHTLEYREAVENELTKQYNLVGGNHYELKGNHDSAGYGMTEYEYYLKKGLLKPSCNMTIGNVHITMVDSGEYNTVVPNIGDEGASINVLLAHDYFKFKDTLMPDFGKAVELDDFTKWYGVDYLICGHIHHQYIFNGMITKEINGQAYGHRMMVQYPGAMSRPVYREGHMEDKGQLIMLTVFDTGEMEYTVLDVELLPLEESFNLSAKAAEKEAKAEKEKRVDISDIIGRLNSHERNVGNPEDIIAAMEGVDTRYKDKAIELLKLGQA